MRSGGEADKLANSYEGLWTIYQLFDLLHGEAVKLEPEPVLDGIGVEFIKTLPDGQRHFHSVKIATPQNGWTVARLAREEDGRSFLGDILDKAKAAPKNHGWFVSIVTANALRILADDARKSATLIDFLKVLGVADMNRRDDFRERIVPLCGGSEQTAFELLQRIHVRSIDQDSLTKAVEREIARGLYRADGVPMNVADVRRMLAEFILDSLRQTVTRETFLDRLAKENLRETDWAHDSEIQDRVNDRNQTYLRHVRQQLINGTHIPRDEAGAAFDFLTKQAGRYGIFVGVAGLGKSCTTADLLVRLQEAGIPILAIRLDIQVTATTTRILGEQLGLPSSPVDVLEGISQGRPAVLVIDQLDALSLVSGRNQNLWMVFEDLINEVETCPNIKVWLACRDFDIEHDHRLRALVERHRAHRIEVRLLEISVVKEQLRAKIDPETLGERQIEMLRTPMHLSLFLESDSAGKPPFQTVQDLYERYWDHKQDKLKEQLGRPPQWREVLSCLCNELSRRQTLSVHADWLEDNTSREDVRALASAYVLVKENGTYRFSHEGFFDYAFARFFVRSGQKVLDLLLEGEQHIFRRAQVRQILTYLRGKEPTRYLEELGILLKTGQVRTHIQKLVLDWMRMLPNPTVEEAQILELDVS